MTRRRTRQRDALIICDRCARAIRSREPLIIGELLYPAGSYHHCEWCGDAADLYACRIP